MDCDLILTAESAGFLRRVPQRNTNTSGFLCVKEKRLCVLCGYLLFYIQFIPIYFKIIPLSTQSFMQSFAEKYKHLRVPLR